MTDTSFERSQILKNLADAEQALADAQKARAEALKVTRETAWYPAVLMTAALTAGIALAKLVLS